MSLKVRPNIFRHVIIVSVCSSILIIGTLLPAYVPSAFATEAFRLYVHNRDRNYDYDVRITNENSRKKYSLSVDAASCNVFRAVDEGKYSIKVFRNRTMYADYAIIEIDDTSCIELSSVTGKVSLCDRNWCVE
jgi:hypothetical protein